MLRIVQLNKGNAAQYNYEKSVAERIERFRDMVGYHFLEEEVQRWIDLHCGDSLDGITARVYMDTLRGKSDDEVKTWAEHFIAAKIKEAAKNVRHINETTAVMIRDCYKTGRMVLVGRFFYQANGQFHGLDTIAGILVEASFANKCDCIDWLLSEKDAPIAPGKDVTK